MMKPKHSGVRTLITDATSFCRSLPGYINTTIFEDTINPGWTWRPYAAKNTALLVQGEGMGGSIGTSVPACPRTALCNSCASSAAGRAASHLPRQGRSGLTSAPTHGALTPLRPPRQLGSCLCSRSS